LIISGSLLTGIYEELKFRTVIFGVFRRPEKSKAMSRIQIFLHFDKAGKEENT